MTDVRYGVTSRMAGNVRPCSACDRRAGVNAFKTKDS